MIVKSVIKVISVIIMGRMNANVSVKMTVIINGSALSALINVIRSGINARGVVMIFIRTVVNLDLILYTCFKRLTIGRFFLYLKTGGAPHTPYMLLHCNNKLCKYNDNQALLYGDTDIHYLDRLCITFKRKPEKDNYTELMRASEPKEYGKWVRN